MKSVDGKVVATAGAPATQCPDVGGMRPDETLAQTYVWKAGRLYFVSTINRDSSAIAAGPHRFAETIVWECDPKTRERGAIIGQDGAGEGSIYAHQYIVDCLHQIGRTHKHCPESAQECRYFCKPSQPCRSLFGSATEPRTLGTESAGTGDDTRETKRGQP